LCCAEFIGWVRKYRSVRPCQVPNAGTAPWPLLARAGRFGNENLGPLVRIGVVEFASQQHAPIVGAQFQCEFRSSCSDSPAVGLSRKNLLAVQMVHSRFVTRNHLHQFGGLRRAVTVGCFAFRLPNNHPLLPIPPCLCLAPAAYGYRQKRSAGLPPESKARLDGKK